LLSFMATQIAFADAAKAGAALCRLGQEIGCIQSERASRVHPIIQRMKTLSKAD
jgi:hypothetical protein